MLMTKSDKMIPRAVNQSPIFEIVGCAERAANAPKLRRVGIYYHGHRRLSSLEFVTPSIQEAEVFP